MEKLTVKAYNSNATVYGEERTLTISYDGDYLACYGDKDLYNDEKEAIAEFESDTRKAITEAFPTADADNIEDVLLTIMIYASCTIACMW